jgi:CheY-like chemotaxis protein
MTPQAQASVARRESPGAMGQPLPIEDRGAGPIARPREAAKVLVVDGDKCMRELLRIHLSNAGYCVTTAEDAVVALKCLLLNRPDLMILDVEMPYMNGLEFAGTLKADPSFSNVPVMLLTAREDLEDAARKLGALVCLRKPLLATRLISAVAAALPTGRRAIG